jgi:hypothetical protein
MLLKNGLIVAFHFEGFRDEPVRFGPVIGMSLRSLFKDAARIITEQLGTHEPVRILAVGYEGTCMALHLSIRPCVRT